MPRLGCFKLPPLPEPHYGSCCCTLQLGGSGRILAGQDSPAHSHAFSLQARAADSRRGSGVNRVILKAGLRRKNSSTEKKTRTCAKFEPRQCLADGGGARPCVVQRDIGPECLARTQRERALEAASSLAFRVGRDDLCWSCSSWTDGQMLGLSCCSVGDDPSAHPLSSVALPTPRDTPRANQTPAAWGHGSCCAA